MDFAEFERLVADALDALPPDVASQLDNVVFLVEPCSPDGKMLGEYRGVPRVDRSDFDVAPLPDEIILFHQDTVEECGGMESEIKEEIRRTLWHEIAHHLGWDDEKLEETERARGWRK